MGTWKTRGLRGSTLEDLINRTNDSYREKKLALIQKIPTPITPIEIDKKSRHITLAYFDMKSTVDYIGAVQGIPVCFDAKECAVRTFPLQNIHPHQIAFMKEFEAQGGVAFIILSFTAENEIYYVPFDVVNRFWDGWKRAEEKALPMMRWCRRRTGSEATGTCMSITWKGSSRILTGRKKKEETAND